MELKILKKYQEEASNQSRKADSMLVEQLETFRLKQAQTDEANAANPGGGGGATQR